MLYPLEEWEQIEASWKKGLTSMSAASRKSSRSDQLLRTRGRDRRAGAVLLPGLLRERANLKGELSVIGSLDHLEVQVHADVRNEVESNPITSEDKQAYSELGL